MLKITKGKWTVSGDKYPTIQSNNTDDKKIITYPTIATVNSTFINEEEYKANAKLIASAPILYEALKTISEKLNETAVKDNNFDNQLRSICINALKSAE